MSGFLLDTNVISEYTRIKPPDERVRSWIDAQDESTLHLSVLSLGEIRKGANLLPPSAKRSGLERWLTTDLRLRFANRLLPIDETTVDLWGSMAAEAKLRGITLAVIDGLVAATARQYGLVVVTRNVRDFAVWGSPVINPWEQ